MENLLSKTTLNFSEKRGLNVSLLDIDEDYTLLSICLESEETDAELCYKCFDGEAFVYYGNTWLNDSVNEELPAHIRDEKHLRQVIDFIAAEVA